MVPRLRLFSILLVIPICIQGFSQTAQKEKTVIKIICKDSTSGRGVEFATISITKRGDPKIIGYAQSDSGGVAIIEKIGEGSYTLRSDHMNYNSSAKELTISKNSIPNNGVFDAGEILMKERSTSLNAVIVSAISNPIIIKRDTIEYNASSFYDGRENTVEALLLSIPGISIDKDGKIMVNGKPVNSILIDGKKFFSGNSEILRKNVPADIIDKVKVLEKKSKQERITGFDDGKRETVIDLSVKKSVAGLWVGNLSAGAGLNERVESNNFVGRMGGNSQTGVTGRYSNYTLDEGLGQREMWNYGANYGYSLSDDKENEKNISGNINGSGSVSKNNSWKKRLNYSAGQSITTDENSESKSRSARNGISFDSNFDMENGLSFMAGGAASYNNSNSDFTKSFTSSKKESGEDQEYLINSGTSSNRSQRSSSGGEFMVMVGKRFKKRGRSLSAVASFNGNKSNSTTYTYTNKEVFDKSGQGTQNITDQLSFSNMNSLTFETRGAYSDALGKEFFYEVAYGINYSGSDSRKNSFNKSAITGGYDIPDSDFSNNINEFTIEQELALNLRKESKKGSLRGGVALRPSFVKSEGDIRNISYHKMNITPNLSFEHKFSREESIRLNYRGNLSQPSIDQTNPVPDNTNPLYIQLGNPNLKGQMMNNINLSYTKSNRKRFQSLSVNSNISFISNRISSLNAYDNKGVKYSLPVNTNGNYSGSLGLMYNSALWSKSLFLNFSTNGKFNKSNSYNAIIENIDDLDPYSVTGSNFTNITARSTYTISSTTIIGLSYKWKDGSANISPLFSYNNTWYNIEDQPVKSYWTNSLSIKVNYNLPKGFALFAENNTFYYIGYDPSRKPQSMCNFSLSKRMCGNKLQISLAGFDLFNNAQPMVRIVGDDFIEDMSNSTPGRYFMLNLVYKFSPRG